MKELTEEQKQAVNEAKEAYSRKEESDIAGDDFHEGMKEVLANPEKYGLMPIPQYSKEFMNTIEGIEEKISRDKQ